MAEECRIDVYMYILRLSSHAINMYVYIHVGTLLGSPPYLNDTSGKTEIHCHSNGDHTAVKQNYYMYMYMYMYNVPSYLEQCLHWP